MGLINEDILIEKLLWLLYCKIHFSRYKKNTDVLAKL
jgi:hypothetical protein